MKGDVMLSKKKFAPKIGEVYATKLPNENWCALVVLSVIENSYLVYTSAYYDLKPPTIDDLKLGDFFYERDYYSDGRIPSIYWLDGKPNNSYYLLGEIDLQEKSNIKESAYYNGIWKVYYPSELMWDKDPSTKEALKESNVTRTENKVEEMPDDTFWELISLIDTNKKNQCER